MIETGRDAQYVDTSRNPNEYVAKLIDDSHLRISEEESRLFPQAQVISTRSGATKGGRSELNISLREDPREEGESRVPAFEFITSLGDDNSEEINADYEWDWDYYGSARRPDLQKIREYEQRAKEIQSKVENAELWDTDLEDDSEVDEEAMHDTSGRVEYQRACRKLGIVPAHFFLKHIEDSKLIMRYHNLGPIGTQAVAKALKANIRVEKLDLSGNGMDVDGCLAISKMLEDNSYIQKLLLSDNSIGDAACQVLCRALMSNTSLRQLDLSGNHLSDNVCPALAEMLEGNHHLTKLDLSRNRIGSRGAELLGVALEHNDFLEVLDLSWNQIRGRGAVSIAKSLRENVRIRYCDLSWNGFANEGGKALADMLRENSFLKSLLVSGNRLRSEAAAAFCRVFTTNESLEHLALSDNAFNTTDMLQLIVARNKAENSGVKRLSLEDIPVDFEFVKTVEMIQIRQPDFVCEFGAELRVGNTPEDIHKEAVNVRSPIILLKEHILINDFRLIEALQRQDVEQKMSVTVEQFAAALEEIKVPFKRAHLRELQSKLDKNGDGTIYYGDFVPPDGPARELDLSLKK